ncbi:MAG: phosphate acyltransferase, partial [Pseudothermotoga sp.]
MSRLSSLIERAKGRKKRLIVAAADDDVVLSAVASAMQYELISPILVGPEKEITKISEQIKIDLAGCQIVDVEKEKAAVKAVEIASRDGDILMKGSVRTGDLMKIVLQEEYGLRTGSTITMVSVFDIPSYHKLLAISDAGMIIAPTFEQKIDMINASVRIMKQLGVEKPKVAIIGAVEVPSTKMPATIDAAVLSKMNDRGQIKNCIIDGPFALDNAISFE